MDKNHETLTPEKIKSINKNRDIFSIYVHKVIIPWHVRIRSWFTGEEPMGTKIIGSVNNIRKVTKKHND